MSVQVLGGKMLKANADHVARSLKEAEDPAALAAAEPIKKRWEALVPVLDGNYRDSLTITWLKGSGKAAIGTAWLDRVPRNEQPVLYAKRLEIGDSEIAAQPSMRPALKAAKDEAVEAGAVPLKTSLRGANRRRVKA